MFDPFSALATLGIKPAGTLIKWVGKKAFDKKPLELAIVATESELREEFNLDLYSALCNWCATETFLELIERMKSAQPATANEFAEDFAKSSGVTTEQSCKVIAAFRRRLTEGLIRENPGLADTRADQRSDALKEAVKQSETNVSAKIDSFGEQMGGQLREIFEFIKSSTLPGKGEDSQTSVKAEATETALPENSAIVTPAYWGKEPFSLFLAASEINIQTTCAEYPEWADRLQRLHSLSWQYTEYLVKRGQVFANLFFFKGHSTVLAAAKLGLCGQTSEAFLLLHAATLEAMMGLYLHRNSDDAELYTRQNDGQRSKERARVVFSPSKLKECLKREDNRLYRVALFLLEVTSNSGSYWEGTVPVSVLKIADDGTWHIVYLSEDDKRYRATMKLIGQVQIFRLLVAGRVYPDFLENKEFAENFAKLLDEF